MSTAGGKGQEYYVKYHPQLSKALGNDNAALIIDRLEYWFAKKSNGFYKFFEPCQHPLYREGDSWLEELGFSRKSFLHAFSFIGTRYSSCTSFHKLQDKFQGKLYASYYARQTHQTFFIRNHQLAEDFLSKIFGGLPNDEQQQSVEPHSSLKPTTNRGKPSFLPHNQEMQRHRQQLPFPPSLSAVPTVHNCRSHRPKVPFPPAESAVPTIPNCRSHRP